LSLIGSASAEDAQGTTHIDSNARRANAFMVLYAPGGEMHLPLGVGSGRLIGMNGRAGTSMQRQKIANRAYQSVNAAPMLDFAFNRNLDPGGCAAGMLIGNQCRTTAGRTLKQLLATLLAEIADQARNLARRAWFAN
jgi:hypothetical protein